MRRTVVERTFSVVPVGILAALLAATAWLFLSAALSGGALPVRSPFSSLERFADWPALYEKGGGDSAYRIPLSFVRGREVRGASRRQPTRPRQQRRAR